MWVANAADRYSRQGRLGRQEYQPTRLCRPHPLTFAEMRWSPTRRLAIGTLTLCVASPAAAQGNLDQGKTAAQLYASACATCHKSPQSVSNTKRFLGLESFLSQHYTSNRESAAILAAYLRGMQTPSADSKRGRSVAKRTSEAMPPEPVPSESEDDIPRPPADIPDVKR
jgi:cytochrome c553